MSEKGKGSLLLPLGIGAGLLLLLTRVKKKPQEPVTTTASDDTAAATTQVSTEAAAVPQIDPAPAPTYAQAMAKTAPGGEGDSEATTETRQAAAPQEPDEEDTDNGQYPQDEQETDDGSDATSSRSAGSSSYGPSPFMQTSRQGSPLPAQKTGKQNPFNRRAFETGKLVVGNQSISYRADKPKIPGRYARTTSNGKPRMESRQPVRQRTDTTTARSPVIHITSRAAIPAKTVVTAQAKIFPLRFGTTSSYVKEVQRKLGVPATGYFGTMTKVAIGKRFGMSEISEALYKQIISGKAPVAVAPVRKPVSKPLRKVKKPLPKRSQIIPQK